MLSRTEIDTMFALKDKDLDGKVSWEEFSGEETKNEKAFKLMDADHNGKITKHVSNSHITQCTVGQGLIL